VCHNDPMEHEAIKLERIGETPTPSRLGPVPEFGRSGESPPLRTEPVIVSSALLMFTFRNSLVEASRPTLTEQELLKRLSEPVFPLNESSGEILWTPVDDPLVDLVTKGPAHSQPDPDSIDYAATKRLVYSQYWKRGDPVIQLVPGETQIYTVQLKSGLTDQVLREFSSTLGLGGNVSAVKLGAQLSGRFNRTVTVSAELETTKTKQLTNTRDGYIRRVAIWHVVHLISVYEIFRGAVVIEPHWIEVQKIEFSDIASPQSSFSDLRIHGAGS
jgi:hypothetical protein